MPTPQSISEILYGSKATSKADNLNQAKHNKLSDFYNDYAARQIAPVEDTPIASLSELRTPQAKAVLDIDWSNPNASQQVDDIINKAKTSHTPLPQPSTTPHVPTQRWDDMPGTSSTSRLGDDIDIAKSAGIQLGAGAIKMVNKVATSIGLNGVMDKLDSAIGGDGKAGMFLKDKDDLPFTNRTIKEVLDPKKGQAIADSMANLNPQVRNEFSTAMAQSEDQWVKGDYLGSMWNAAQNLDRLLAQSAPETAALMIPYAGAPMVAATRASNQADKYAQNNPGKQFTPEQYAESFLANMALLIPEKILIKSGIADTFGSKMTGAGKLGTIGRSTAGETLQEYGEGVQEQYAIQQDGAQTLGEVMTDPKSVYQGAIGGLMGGTLSGVGMGAKAVPDVLGAVKDITYKGLDAAARTATGKTKEQVLSEREARSTTSVTEMGVEDVKTSEPIKDMTEVKQEATEAPTTEKETYSVYEEMKPGMDERQFGLYKEAQDIIKNTTPENEMANAERLVQIEEEINTPSKQDVLAQQLKDEGMSDNEIQDIQKRYNSAGLVNKITAEDRAKGLGVELLGDSKIGEVNKKKGSLYDVGLVDDQLINEVGTKGLDIVQFKGKTNSKITNSIKRLVKKIGLGGKDSKALQETYAKVKESLSNEKVQTHLKSIYGDVEITPAMAMRAIGIATAEVANASIGEYDIGQSSETEANVNGARKLGTDTQIGKAFVNSFGIKLKGKDTDMAQKYQEIGNDLIEAAKEAGLLVEESDKSIPRHKMHTKDKQTGEVKAVYQDKDISHIAQKGTEEGTYKGSVLRVASMKEGYVNRKRDDVLSDEDNQIEALVQFNKLFNPANYEAPSAKPQTKVHNDPNSPISEEHRGIIEKINKMRFKIKPEFIKFLEGIDKMVPTEDDGTKNYDQFFSSNKKMKEFLGLDNESTNLTKLTEAGHSINRQGSLIKLLESLDELKEMSEGEGFHFNYESAINQRIHVMQTILDFQGDKFMARQMLTGGEYAIDTDSKEYAVLVEDLRENFNKEMSTEEFIKEINNPTGTLAEAFMYIKAGKLGYNEVANMYKELGFKSPFKAMSTLQGMYDLSKAKDGKVTTDYMVEADATASGVMNTLLNLAGFPGVREIIAKIGIGRTDGKKADPYTYVNEEIKAYFKDIEGAKEYKVVQKVWDLLGERDVAKSPVMTWFYGQAKENLNKTMGDSIAIDLISKVLKKKYSNGEVLSWINDILGSEYNQKNMGNISKADKAKLVKYFGENVGQVYANIMEGTDNQKGIFAPVKEYRNLMGQIYDELEKSKQWNGTISTAMDKLLGQDPKKMSIKKLKQVVSRPNAEKDLLQVNQMLNNKTSFNVNLQHATDAALLLMAMDKVLGDKIKKGIMTVHDAFYSDPATSIKIMEEYDKLTTDAAVKYDYVTAALDEVKDVLSKMEDSIAKDELQAKYDKWVSENKTRTKEKNESLKQFTPHVLGSPEVIGYDYTIPNYDPSDRDIQEVYNLHKDIQEAMKDTFTAQGLENLLNTIGDKVSKSHKGLLEKVRLALYDKQNITFDESLELSKGEFDEYAANVKHVYIPTVDVMGKDARTGDEISIDGLIETLAHEVDHAYQMGYILREGKESVEVRYLQKVLDKLAEPSNTLMESLPWNVRARLQYAIDMYQGENKAYGVIELTAILSSEPEVMTAISGVKSTVLEKAMEYVQRFLDKVTEWVNKLLETDEGKVELNKYLKKELDRPGNTNLKAVQTALRVLDANARVQIINQKYGSDKATGMAKVKKPQDIHKDQFRDPLKNVNDVINRANEHTSEWMILFADTIETNWGPAIKEKHENAKRNHRLYREMISMIRTGLYDSDFAQRMHRALGIAGDVSMKLLDDLQQLGTQMMQESKNHVVDMAEMGRKVKKFSKADQKKLNDVFSHTGIANLLGDKDIYKGITDGSLSVKDALVLASKGMSEETIKKLDDVANYMVTHETKTNAVNTSVVDDTTGKARVYVSLKALEMVDGQDLLVKMDKPLRDWMMQISLMNKDTNAILNEKGNTEYGKPLSLDAEYSNDYDGTYSKDIFRERHEFRMVTEEEMRGTKYSSENDWFVLKKPTKDNPGFIARKSMDAGTTPGVGLEINKYDNGMYLDQKQSDDLFQKLGKMSKTNRETYLKNNGIVQDGNRFKFLIDRKTKVEKLGLIEDVAERLYRTYIHNQELIQSQAIRDMVLAKGIDKLTTKEEMNRLNKVLEMNYKGGFNNRTPVLPFLKISYDYGSFDDLKESHPYVAMYYKTPSNLSTFNDFNKNITLVKRGESEVLLGHKNFSLFGGREDMRKLAEYEQVFKKLIVLAKQKMIVTAPVKLMLDFVSNVGILTMMGMSPIEVVNGMKDAWDAYHQYSAARGRLVDMKLQARIAHATMKSDPSAINTKAYNDAMAKMGKWETKMKKMDFHKAFESGFMQSYSTDLVIKEFDTISGIQKDIDDIFDKYTHDEKGDPNKLYGAIKKWQEFGGDKANVDTFLSWLAKVKGMKGTTMSKELEAISQRLKNKKDMESVSRYMSEIIGAPSSEVVSYGGAAMVLSDALSKYTLAKYLEGKVDPKTKKRYDKDTAYSTANHTFIDYRYNLPKEVKALSDYGILMFPAFWIRIQKVIASLVLRHPVSSLGNYGVQSYLDIAGANVIGEALPFKEKILFNPVDTVSWEGLVLGAALL